MSENGVEITFTEDELNPDFKPEAQTETKEETNVEEKEGVSEEKQDDKQEVSDESSDDETKANEQVAKTDAELAEIHGVSEEEIKYAKNMGWSPKENFHGNPKDWKAPKEFIDVAEQSNPILRDRLREMSKKVTEMQKFLPTILEMQKRELQNKVDSLTNDNERLQQELEEAHLLADSKKAAELTEKIMENKLKVALAKEEQKHVGDKEGVKQNDKVITPDHIDVERERAWRNSIFPKLTLEQREIYNEAVRFVTSPINADQNTDQRIAYIESKLFGRQSRPSVASVARPSATDTTEPKKSNNEYEVWDSFTKEEKEAATSMLSELDWFKNRETTGKAQWNEFKKSFRK